MKSSILSVLFALAVIINKNLAGSIKKADKNSFVASAIGEIIEKFYENNDHRVDFLCYPCKTTKSIDLLNELLKHNKNVTFGVLKPRKSIRINNSTIMIFDIYQDHKMFVTNISFDLYSTTEKYNVIYYPEMEENEKMMSIHMKYKNFNYLGDFNETHLSLLTFMYVIILIIVPSTLEEICVYWQTLLQLKETNSEENFMK
jgi:hypothetical protein